MVDQKPVEVQPLKKISIRYSNEKSTLEDMFGDNTYMSKRAKKVLDKGIALQTV